MIKSLISINNPKQNMNEIWLNYLYNTRETKYNILNVNSKSEINAHSVLNYVKRTLEVLDLINNKKKLNNKVLSIIEDVLKWSEVGKTGNKKVRKEWKNKGYNLFCHNISSADIYKEFNDDYITYVLIKTHGLIGQYVKGEINLDQNIDIYNLVKDKKIEKSTLRKILVILNECIITGISESLYLKVKDEVNNAIDRILNGDFKDDTSIIDRMKKLNRIISDSDVKYLNSLNKKANEKLAKLFNSQELWYFDGALKNFSIENQIKILLIISNFTNEDIKHITFESLMQMLYLDYKDKKEINLYKFRIIESYLKEISLKDILENNINNNPHISYNVIINLNTISFNFKFSLCATKLIEFCEAALTSDILYQKATYMLYDLFGFRRDAYDRFYNEFDYLKRMNAGVREKSIILDYIVGKNIIDVGPGGGVLLDLIELKDPTLNITGIDLSQNVIDKLTDKKLKENHIWNLVKGDALNLTQYFDKNSIDTIIYSSIIHELYSYISYEGKKFNKETIKKALKEAYDTLCVGGRIIIRDGVMTDPKDQYRIIEFKNSDDLKILNRYIKDFKGRKVVYEKINDNTVKMLVNDAMEFLYTYTWGEASYPLEVQEQFGYFTVKEYVDFIRDNLPASKIVEAKSFLQDGYEINLLPKINIYDENKNVVKLPDSTMIIVIEKGDLC